MLVSVVLFCFNFCGFWIIHNFVVLLHKPAKKLNYEWIYKSHIKPSDLHPQRRRRRGTRRNQVLTHKVWRKEVSQSFFFISSSDLPPASFPHVLPAGDEGWDCDLHAGCSVDFSTFIVPMITGPKIRMRDVLHYLDSTAIQYVYNPPTNSPLWVISMMTASSAHRGGGGSVMF